jgi:flagellar protein FlbD
MIHLTRLNRLPLVLNADLIETIEVTPDTVISLTTGQKLVVREPAEEVVRRVVEFRRAIYGGSLLGPSLAVPSAPPGGPMDADDNRTEHVTINRADS